MAMKASFGLRVEFEGWVICFMLFHRVIQFIFMFLYITCHIFCIQYGKRLSFWHQVDPFSRPSPAQVSQSGLTPVISVQLWTLPPSAAICLPIISTFSDAPCWTIFLRWSDVAVRTTHLQMIW